MSRIANWWRSWEITIDSDWITTSMMALLLVVCGLFLVRDAGRLSFNNFAEQPASTHSFTNILNIAAAAFGFILLFGVRGKFLKIALLLMVGALTGHIVIAHIHVSLATQRTVSVTGSVLRQIAYTIFLVAILQWFKSVVRWVTPSRPKEGNGTTS